MSDLHTRRDQFLVTFARMVFQREQKEPGVPFQPVPVDEIKAEAGATDGETEDAVRYLARRGYAEVVPYPSGNRDLMITSTGREAADRVGGSHRVRRPD